MAKGQWLLLHFPRPNLKEDKLTNTVFMFSTCWNRMRYIEIWRSQSHHKVLWACEGGPLTPPLDGQAEVQDFITLPKSSPATSHSLSQADHLVFAFTVFHSTSSFLASQNIIRPQSRVCVPRKALPSARIMPVTPNLCQCGPDQKAELGYWKPIWTLSRATGSVIFSMAASLLLHPVFSGQRTFNDLALYFGPDPK